MKKPASSIPAEHGLNVTVPLESAEDMVLADPATGQARSGIVSLASWFSIVVGFLVLTGWAFEIESFKVVLPGLVAMKVNAAIGFVLLGTALELITSRPTTAWKLRWGRLAAVGVLLIGGATVIEYCFGWDAGIDEFFVVDPTDTSPYHGRPAPATILNFCLLSIALLMIGTERRACRAILQAFVLLSLLLSTLALVGYAFGVIYGYRTANDTYPFATMALHTAVCFTMICAGMLYSRNDFRLIRASQKPECRRRIFAKDASGRIFHYDVVGMATTPRRAERPLRTRVWAGDFLHFDDCRVLNVGLVDQPCAGSRGFPAQTG